LFYRGIAEPYVDSNDNINADVNTDCYSYTDTYGAAKSNRNSYRYLDSHCHSDSYCDSYRKPNMHAWH
jgi:3-hydroxy-3-methylglutaryl CoA synthase